MRDEPVISFPHMGDYHVPAARLLKTLFPGQEVRPAPPITRKTVELGARNSPDFVCAPFKYNMGNYIEALESGANVLLQTGMGCRYGYYGEVQEQILRDLGYRFRFVSLARERARPGALFQTLRALGSPLSRPQILHALLLALESVRLLDGLDFRIRERAGFEETPGSFEALRLRLLDDLSEVRSFRQLARARELCARGFSAVRTDMPARPLRVGIIGELYTVMEPSSNFYIERRLAENRISVSRAMNVSYLLFGKRDRRSLRQTGGYLRYTVGATGVDSVAQCRKYAALGYDGVIHMKSFGCTPELNAMPALARLGQDFGLPILHLSFDLHTSETGLQTRLEAFCDMLEMRRSCPGIN